MEITLKPMPDHGPSDANTPRQRRYRRRLVVGILMKRKPKHNYVNDSIPTSSSLPLRQKYCIVRSDNDPGLFHVVFAGYESMHLDHYLFYIFRFLVCEAIKEAPLPCYTLLKHMSPLLVFVPLKYQVKGDNNQINNLFDENPIPVWSFIGVTCLYCLLLELKKQMESQVDNICMIHEILRRTALASGVLTAVSLISIFLPHRLSFIPLVMWTPLPLLLAWPLLYYAYALLRKGITILGSNIHVGIAKLTDEASLPV